MGPETTAVRAALRARGLDLGPRLGAGVEGTVFAIDDALVGKVWRARSRADLRSLQRFTEAVDAVALPFATPLVVDVIDVPGAPLISLERRLRGVPLRVDGRPAPPSVSEAEAGILADVLAALAAVSVTPDIDALPLLPGEERTSEVPAFPERLARLVERRTADLGAPVREALPHVDGLAAAVAERLRAVETPPPGLVHGDLIPANVLVQDGQVTAVLDFGFLTAAGDPRFDAAVTASVFDMYGPHARASERALDDAFPARSGTDEQVRGVYRAAYALATATWFGAGVDDGHLRWCLRMLGRPDVLEAVHG